MYLDSMPHPALCLNQIVIAPGVCKVETKSLVSSQLSLPTALSSKKRLHVGKICGGTSKVSIRISCNLRGSSVIDAELVVDTSSWQLEEPKWQ